MKKRTLIMAAAVALGVLGTTRGVEAQQLLVVNVPFDFIAGNQVLPAGEYAVEDVGPQHNLVLVNRSYSVVSPLLNSNATIANQVQTESKLVFNRYGDRYFLSQVWSAGDACGRQLLKSAREKEIAESAKMENQGQVTLVAELSRTNR